MKKTFILSVILLIVGNVHTQPLAWSKQTTRGFISSFYVTTDNTGNVFTTGWFNDTTDFDPGPGVYKLFSRNPSTYLSKLDRNGNFLWAVNVADLSGNGNSSAGRFGITTDLYGNVYVAGFFKGTCDFDPGSGTKLLTVNTTTPSPYGYDQFVWKLDANGNFIWVKQLATNQFVSTCLTDASGNLLVSGSFNGTCDFDPGPGTQTLKSLGVSDGYICTFDQAGNILDVKQFGYTGTNASISSLSFDTFSNIIAIGSFTGTVDADPGPGTFILSAAGSQFFTTQLNSTGNFVTARSIIPLGTSKITKLSTDFYGNTYVEGTFTGSCDFDPSVSVHTLQTSAPMAIFVYKLSPTGGFTWAKKVDLQSSLNQYPHIRSDGGGNVHFTGVFNGTVDVDPGSAVHTLSTQPY